jgi:hypothetical protein
MKRNFAGGIERAQALACADLPPTDGCGNRSLGRVDNC